MVKLDVGKALAELRDKPIEEIERLTAVTWASRSAAAFHLARHEPDMERRRRWLMDGENYRQEALEHAAMSEDWPFLHSLVAALEDERAGAIVSVRAA